jgi:hypothetical protein
MEFEPLRMAYNRATGEALEGAPFLRLVHFLTTRADAPALPTGVPDIHRHEVRLPGTAHAVHVLRRDGPDGFLTDLRLAPSDRPADVRRITKAMQAQAQRTAAARAGLAAVLAKRKEAGSSSAESAAAGRPPTLYKQLWVTRRKQLAPLHKEYVETLRGKRRFSGADLVKLLQQRAEQPGASEPTGTDGIHRCCVRLPGFGRDIRFLMNRDPAGKLTDLHLLRSAEEEHHAIG